MPKSTLAPTLDSILERMKARAIVIGHTTVLPGKITARLGGRVIQIDTGMVNGEFYPGGVPSALELQGDKVTAIYLDRREPLHCSRSRGDCDSLAPSVQPRGRRLHYLRVSPDHSEARRHDRHFSSRSVTPCTLCVVGQVQSVKGAPV